MSGSKLMAMVMLGLALAGVAVAHAASKQAGQDVYEDDEVRITIPRGWSRASGNYPSLEPYRMNGVEVVGSAALQAEGRLLLRRYGYTLALAYWTQHASGVPGGRFIEAFDIPWLNPDQAWSQCSGILTVVSQPASRTLLFQTW